MQRICYAPTIPNIVVITTHPQTTESNYEARIITYYRNKCKATAIVFSYIFVLELCRFLYGCNHKTLTCFLIEVRTNFPCPLSLLHVVIHLPVSMAKRDTNEGWGGNAASCHFLSLGYYNVYMDLLLEIFIVRGCLVRLMLLQL